jgi:hypothetical protein
MTLLTTIIVGLNLFSYIGFEDHVIQNPRGDEEPFLNTVWTFQVLRGIGLWLVMVIVAWPVAHFYDQRLLWLLPFVGFASVISGFSSPNLPLAITAPWSRKIVTAGAHLSVHPIWRCHRLGLLRPHDTGAGSCQISFRTGANVTKLSISEGWVAASVCVGTGGPAVVADFRALDPDRHDDHVLREPVG